MVSAADMLFPLPNIAQLWLVLFGMLASGWFLFVEPVAAPSQGLPEAYGMDVNDPHWPAAHEDQHLRIERGREVLLESGRVVRSDIFRLYPDEEHDEEDGERRVFVFFPGNPGMLEFYLVFLRKVFERSGRKWYVCAISHAGHSQHSFVHGGPVSFEEQIDHKVQFLKEEFPWLHGQQRKGHAVLCGHSVGARIGLEVMHRTDDTIHFERYFGLCPTVINIAQSPSGVRVSGHLSSDFKRALAFQLVRIAKFVLNALPRFILHPVAKALVPPSESYYIQHCISLVDPHIIENVFHMANEEMQMILGHSDPAISHAAENHMDRLTFVLSTIDHWCDDKIIAQMKEIFSSAEFVFLRDDITHAFSMKHDHVDEVVNAIMESKWST